MTRPLRLTLAARLAILGCGLVLQGPHLVPWSGVLASAAGRAAAPDGRGQRRIPAAFHTAGKGPRHAARPVDTSGLERASGTELRMFVGLGCPTPRLSPPRVLLGSLWAADRRPGACQHLGAAHQPRAPPAPLA